MPVIKAKKIPKKIERAEDILARFCYHFPRYSYEEARKLPAVRVNKMLKIAKKEYAIQMHDLIGIISAPHTKGGVGVKKMRKYFKDIIES